MAVYRTLLLIACLCIVPATAYTAIKHDINLRLDPSSREIQIVDRFITSAGASLEFKIATWFEVVEVKVRGEQIHPERKGRMVSIPGIQGRSGWVVVTLEGRVPMLPGPDERAASSGAVSGAEGAYLPGSAAWLPQFGAERILYDLTVEVPRPHRVVATGRLIGEWLDDEVYRASFSSDTPTEPPSVFAGLYIIDERVEAGLRLRTYFHSELAPLAGDYLKHSSDYIKAYANRIGAYPYADFHVISAPLPVGLGFPNLTYVGRQVLPLPFMRGRSLAHEILHNWWGNGVAIDYATGNWAEGLTTYMADYDLAEQRGEAAAQQMRLGWLKDFAALPPQRDMPVEGFTGKQNDSGQVIGYNKVAFIFHMLKREVGEAAFGTGLRMFWNNRRFRVGAWQDLKHAFEQASGTDLEWFFEQWLRRPGAPRLELAAAGSKERGAGHSVGIKLKQTTPPYRLRVPVVIETSAGSRQTDVVLYELEQNFDIPTQHKPLSVRVDPHFDAFRRLLPGESPPIFRDVTLSEQTVLVLVGKGSGFAHAAQTLAGRLLQRQPTVYEGRLEDLPNIPVLIIGATKDIKDLRVRIGSAQAVDVAEAGTARAWIEVPPGATSMLFVSANDAESLQAVLRPLPHYRSQSYVVFNASKAVDKGLWPLSDSPLIYRFAGG